MSATGRSYHDVLYLIDGQLAIDGTAGMEEFIDANDFDDAMVKALRALKPGDRYTIDDGTLTAISCIDADADQPCGDCGRPVYYDYERSDYRHRTEPERGCFLIRAEVA
jgi:hypothetical protein